MSATISAFTPMEVHEPTNPGIFCSCGHKLDHRVHRAVVNIASTRAEITKLLTIKNGSRAQVEETRQAIRDRVAFRTHGALSAVSGNPGKTGQLPAVAVRQYEEHANDIEYVVFSWETPIAWFVGGNVNCWFVPLAYYSQSTSIHQGAVRGALALGDIDYTTVGDR